MRVTLTVDVNITAAHGGGPATDPAIAAAMVSHFTRAALDADRWLAQLGYTLTHTITD